MSTNAGRSADHAVDGGHDIRTDISGMTGLLKGRIPIVNLKAATAIDLPVSPSLLVRGDEVIE
jgi:hypothetical protein